MGKSKKYWLLKSEPGVFSIDDLQRLGVAHWEGVRNFQARNYLRDELQAGDGVLIYHSNAKPSGLAGLAEVCKAGHPDHFAFDKKSKYYDPKSKKESPTWYMVDVRYVGKLKRLISLEEMKAMPELQGMLVIQKGSRLSVQPVQQHHFEFLANQV